MCMFLRKNREWAPGMGDLNMYDKCIIREFACRLCLANDITKLKPLTGELKRKLKKLFNIQIDNDDNLPRAICQNCLIEVGALHRFAIRVEKMQTFLEHHKIKSPSSRSPYLECKDDDSSKCGDGNPTKDVRKRTIQSNEIQVMTTAVKQNEICKEKETISCETKRPKKLSKVTKNALKRKEFMPLDELIQSEGIDCAISEKAKSPQTDDKIDPIVLVNGKPAKQGEALDKQITLFYKMNCNICKETGFSFKTLMKHYKERHGVVGYVTCCGKKFHYFNPVQIIEHMAYHLQPGIFSCPSCHEHFQSSNELREHAINGGSRNGKVNCLRCGRLFATYRELGRHLVKVHRSDMFDCDYCGKILKAQRRRRTINEMEDVILCAQCTKLMKSIEKQIRMEARNNV